MKNSTLHRRDFTKMSLLAMFSGVAVTISGCGGGGGGSNSPNPPTTTPPASGDKIGAISSNHGHAVRITAAQMQAGGAVTLSLGGAVGTTDHTHSVDLTAAEVASVTAGGRVSKTSTTGDAHDHIVTFN